MIKLDHIAVQGTPKEMGEAHGRELRTDIQRFVAGRFSYLEKYTGLRGCTDTSSFGAIASESYDMFKAWDPVGAEEHDAIAAAAKVDTVDLYGAANLTDLRDALLARVGIYPSGEDEGCTAALAPGSSSADGSAIVGQTWDLVATDMENVIAVHRAPSDGPASWSVSCVGCLTLMGVNTSNLVVGTTNIKTYGARPGIGYMNLLHRAIRTANVSEAIRVIESAHRAGAHIYWLADPTQQVELAVGPRRVFRRDTSAGPLGRTNHCLHPEMQAIQAEAPNASTNKRLATVENALGRGGLSVERFVEIFSDRTHGSDSISRHLEDECLVATNACFIASPDECIAYACRGPADKGEWLRLDANDSVPTKM